MCVNICVSNVGLYSDCTTSITLNKDVWCSKPVIVWSKSKWNYCISADNSHFQQFYSILLRKQMNFDFHFDYIVFVTISLMPGNNSLLLIASVEWNDGISDCETNISLSHKGQPLRFIFLFSWGTFHRLWKPFPVKYVLLDLQRPYTYNYKKTL